MRATSEEVTVLGFGQWDDEQPRYGEWVRVKSDTDEDTRRYSIDKSINGDRPAEGERVTLDLLSRMKDAPFVDAGGRAQSRRKEAWKVMGFNPVKAVKAAA